MSVEFDRRSPGKFDSRTLNRKTLGRWTGRIMFTEQHVCIVDVQNVCIVQQCMYRKYIIVKCMYSKFTLHYCTKCMYSKNITVVTVSSYRRVLSIIYIYIYICIHTHIHIHIHIHISLSLSIYIYMYIHTYIHMYIYIYIHMCTSMLGIQAARSRRISSINSYYW